MDPSKYHQSHSGAGKSGTLVDGTLYLECGGREDIVETNKATTGLSSFEPFRQGLFRCVYHAWPTREHFGSI